jgi:hypothetical protein
MYIQFPSNETAAGVQRDIESSDAARNAFRAAIVISAEAVFADRGEVAVDCSHITVGTATGTPPTHAHPHTAHTARTNTRTL